METEVEKKPKTKDIEKSSNTGWNHAKDLSQKFLQGYGLAILQLPFWIVAIFDLTPEELEFMSDNIKWYFGGGYGVLGFDLFRKFQSLKNK